LLAAWVFSSIIFGWGVAYTMAGIIYEHISRWNLIQVDDHIGKKASIGAYSSCR